MTDVQLDLFGEVEAAQDEQDAGAVRRAEFERRARYFPDGTEVIWTAPWDCSDGTPKGTTLPGWRCWLCGDIEASDWLLDTNHWLSSRYPQDRDRQECYAQRQRRRFAELNASGAITGEAL